MEDFPGNTPLEFYSRDERRIYYFIGLPLFQIQMPGASNQGVVEDN